MDAPDDPVSGGWFAGCVFVCACVLVCVVVVVVVWNCVYGRALCAEVGRERMKAGLGDVMSLSLMCGQLGRC